MDTLIKRNSVNKGELISSIAQKADTTKANADRALEAVLSSITGALAKSEEVRLIGFGTFSVFERAETKGRNPRTGEAITIPARKMVRFRSGKQLKEAL
ncbi:MAG: HU family DNA-binding protein [Alphaproteobacteria bacterium]